MADSSSSYQQHSTAPAGAAGAATLGMRLDQFLDSWNHWNSTQLYVLIVVTTMALSYAVLSQGPAATNSAEEMQWTTSTTKQQNSNNKTNTHKTTPINGPEPKWHIFKWVNVVALALFVYSGVDFVWHQCTTVEPPTTLWKFLVAWSVLLCYFFGFFGVSLVHDTMDAVESSSSSNNNSIATEAPTLGTSEENSNSSSNAAYCKSTNKKTTHTILPAAQSTPVCGTSGSNDAAFCKSASTITINSNNNAKNYSELSDDQIAQLVLSNKLKDHELEQRLDCNRAVAVRRLVVQTKLCQIGMSRHALDALPHQHSLDYSRVHGANCEIVVGYVPIPVGMCGPLTLNGATVFVPMATTEGCLVASTNRGCKAITQGGGATAVIVRDGITRAPCVRLPSAQRAAHLKLWIDEPQNFATLKTAFEATTSFGKLQQCLVSIAGRNVYLRLQCFSGDAMGMNMVSKGSLAVIECLKQEFPDLTLVALSGNMCTDKKAAAINWIEGRGKSVVVEAIIPKDVVQSTLKTTVSAMVHTNLHKNLIGSAMAGTVGGFNAHASNIVTAIFLATGQDPAQNVESSNCITLLEEDPDTGDLWASCTMPSLEVGTVGGGTSLAAQASCLRAMGCQGATPAEAGAPGENAQQLARIVAAATLAGELSLLAALAANTLVAAHMQHNRKPATTQLPAKSS